MDDKKELIRHILDVEQGASKRVPGLLYELCFFDQLYSNLKPRHGLSSPETGWCYITPYQNNEIRHGFRIGNEDSVLSRTELKLFDVLAPQEHKFFLVIIRQLAVADAAPPAPAVSIDVREWLQANAPATDTSSAREYAVSIAAGIEKGFQLTRWGGSRSRSGDWFRAVSTESLRALFLMRCLMNFGLRHPVDVDALALNGADELVVVEFKRKNPAKGRLSYIRKKIGRQADLVADAIFNRGMSFKGRLSGTRGENFPTRV